MDAFQFVDVVGDEERHEIRDFVAHKMQSARYHEKKDWTSSGATVNNVLLRVFGRFVQASPINTTTLMSVYTLHLNNYVRLRTARFTCVAAIEP